MTLDTIMIRPVFIALSLVGIATSGVIFKTKPFAAKSNCSVEVNAKAYEKYKAQLANVNREVYKEPVAVCFAPGTDQAVVNAFQQAMQATQGWPAPNQYQLAPRWTGNQGDPFTVRWSFVPDGLQITGGVGEPDAGSTLFAGMDAKFGGNRAAWIAKFDEMFARWSEVSGLRYVRVTNGTDPWDDNAAWGQPGADGLRGDVRIGMKPIDGPSGVLAYNGYPQNGDMVLDAGESWGQSNGGYRFLFNVLAHEHGHGMGLAHVCPIQGTKLMEPFYDDGYYGPQQDDIRASQRLYGDNREPDNSIATASNVGAFNQSSDITLGNIVNANNATSLSIDANGEEDFFKITLSSAARLTATVTPVGTTYGSGPQTGNCDSGTSTNALNQADLAIDIVNSSGATIASASANPSSQAEVVAADLVSAGTYYVRVHETNNPSQSQLYRLRLQGSSASGIITGTITFQDWVSANSSLPITVVVRNATTQALVASVNTTTNSLGQYYVVIPGMSANTSYKISVDGLMWLRRSQTVTTPGSISLSGLNFALPNGDSDGNGEVDAIDIDAVIAAFGQTISSPGFQFARDIDGSGEVDASDIDVVIANFGAVDE